MSRRLPLSGASLSRIGKPFSVRRSTTWCIFRKDFTLRFMAVCNVHSRMALQCHGEGRVTAVNVTVKPMSYTDLAEAMFTMQSELDFLHGELTKMRRTQELLYHNLAAITKEWVEVNPDISNMLHPQTPQSWYAPRVEEYWWRWWWSCPKISWSSCGRFWVFTAMSPGPIVPGQRSHRMRPWLRKVCVALWVWSGLACAVCPRWGSCPACHMLAFTFMDMNRVHDLFGSLWLRLVNCFSAEMDVPSGELAIDQALPPGGRGRGHSPILAWRIATWPSHSYWVVRWADWAPVQSQKVAARSLILHQRRPLWFPRCHWVAGMRVDLWMATDLWIFHLGPLVAFLHPIMPRGQVSHPCHHLGGCNMNRRPNCQFMLLLLPRNCTNTRALMVIIQPGLVTSLHCWVSRYH